MWICLSGYLFRLRQNGLNLAQVAGDDPLLRARLVSLDHARDQISIPILILSKVDLVCRLAKALQDHLLGRHRRDAAEIMRSVVEFTLENAFGVEFLRVNDRRAGVAIDL